MVSSSSSIDGLIILEPSGRPIIQTNFRNASASYPHLHVDAFNDALARSKSSGTDLDGVLHVNAPAGIDRPTSACCHVERGGLRFLCIVSQDVDPLFVFTFLETFIQTLQEYLGHISPGTVKDNFDVVYQLLEEMLDDGNPLTTESNTLRDIVLPPSLLNKILSVAGVSGLSAASPAPFSSPIPWRKSGLRYNNNEIYFDIEEEIEAIISKNGAVVSSDSWGKVKCNSKLSGTPDLHLKFTNSNMATDVSFHPCVRLSKYASTKTLSFVPPDGHFVLMEYRLSQPKLQATSNVQIPILFKPTVEIAELGGSISFTIQARSTPVESVVVSFFLGKNTTSVNCSLSSSFALRAPGTSSANGKETTWGYDPRTQTMRWELPSVTTVPQTLNGTFTSTDIHPQPSRAVQITFTTPQRSLSGIKVDQLKLVGEPYKPYKGVRVNGRGSIEWRV